MTQLDGFADAHLHLPSVGYQRKRVGVAARMKFADSGARDELA
jgi:hypothetical protein